MRALIAALALTSPAIATEISYFDLGEKMAVITACQYKVPKQYADRLEILSTAATNPSCTGRCKELANLRAREYFAGLQSGTQILSNAMTTTCIR